MLAVLTWGLMVVTKSSYVCRTYAASETARHGTAPQKQRRHVTPATHAPTPILSTSRERTTTKEGADANGTAQHFKADPSPCLLFAPGPSLSLFYLRGEVEQSSPSNPSQRRPGDLVSLCSRFLGLLRTVSNGWNEGAVCSGGPAVVPRGALCSLFAAGPCIYQLWFRLGAARFRPVNQSFTVGAGARSARPPWFMGQDATLSRITPAPSRRQAFLPFAHSMHSSSTPAPSRRSEFSNFACALHALQLYTYVTIHSYITLLSSLSAFDAYTFHQNGS